MNLHTLTIVGVGLIGGSIGLAVRERGLAQRIIGVGHRRETLDTAIRLGAIDEGTLDLSEGVRSADLVVFCTPVDMLASQVLEAAPHCQPGTLITDAGSTKSRLVAEIEAGLPPGIHFVGSHPLAGSEKRGPEHADAGLFQGRVTVLTPTPRSETTAVERTCAFWEALGSRVLFLPPEEHDRGLALTSHLPHLLASALAGILPPGLHDLTATGFRDTTRIAAGDPGLWSAIFLHNRTAVLAATELVQERLAEFKLALLAQDQAALHSLLLQAKKVRDALGS